MIGVFWMCMRSLAEGGLTRGILQGLASMLIGRLKGIEPSNRMDRGNIVVGLFSTDEIIRGLSPQLECSTQWRVLL